MAVIYKRDYNLTRKKLCSENAKIIKTGIQDLLYLFETGHKFPGSAKIEMADCEAFVIRLLKHTDHDIRKWLYHMLCFVPLNETKQKILRCCLDNIPLELSNNNIENISWIVAVCGATSDSLSLFESSINSADINAYLSEDQIRLASSAFRINPFYEFNHEQISLAVDEIDPISPIWITKTYANQFVPVMKKQGYLRSRAAISNNAFASLLCHSDEEVRKYTMWAFAQEPGGNMLSIVPYVSVDQIYSLEAGMQKWLFVKMFQDYDFLRRNDDLIEDIGRKMMSFPPNVREGILLGCKKLGYSSVLEEFITDWEARSHNESENNLLSLYEYIFSNSTRSGDFTEIANYAKENIEKIPYSTVKNYVKQYSMEGSKEMSERVFNGVQIFNSDINNTTITGQVIHGGDQNTQTSRNEIDAIKAKIENIRSEIDCDREYTDNAIAGLSSHLEYSIDSLRTTVADAAQLKKIEELGTAIQEIKTSNPKNRGKRIQDLLSVSASMLTIAANSPQVVAVVQEIIQFIKAAL